VNTIHGSEVCAMKVNDLRQLEKESVRAGKTILRWTGVVQRRIKSAELMDRLAFVCVCVRLCVCVWKRMSAMDRVRIFYLENSE